MEDQVIPWSWSEDQRLTLRLSGGETRTFSLIATDPKKVMAFSRRLARAQGITKTLHDATGAFAEGRAEYGDAVRRLKKLHEEWQKASAEQYEVALDVCSFFREPGMRECFDFEDVNALTAIACEVVDRLGQAAANAMVRPAAAPPPTPPPQPPAEPEAAPKDPDPVAPEGSAASAPPAEMPVSGT